MTETQYPIRSLCVFCGSSFGRLPEYRLVAEAFGTLLAKEQIALVYGGAKVGLMGAVADATLNAGGQVYGVLPRHLQDREIAHEGLTELFIVDSMHARKSKMAELSDAFVAIPGGAGTMEELFEVWTWGQLGLHSKPCGVLNTNGFYSHLIALLDHMAAENFLKSEYRAMLQVSDSPEGLIRQFRSYAPPEHKWQQPQETVSSVG